MLYRNELFRCLTKTDLRLFNEVIDRHNLCVVAWRNVGENMPGCEIHSCHILSIALSIIIPELRVVTGELMGIRYKLNKVEGTITPSFVYEDRSWHSWLATPDGAYIDPIPVGFVSSGPILIPTVDGQYHAYMGAMYLERRHPDDLNLEQLEKPDLNWADLRAKGAAYAEIMCRGNVS